MTDHSKLRPWLNACKNWGRVSIPPEVIEQLLDTIDAMTRERDNLEREARAGRELRNNMHSDEGGYFTVLRGHVEAYDTATKETGQ